MIAMGGWWMFAARMPTRADANKDGLIEAKERNGNQRMVMWDWVPSPEHWLANDFISWRKGGNS